ncbi:MAG TPA: BatA domain-containing protein [Gemmatimonadaceae bacterium]|nr:BatA domain-containing protein [Gemmatimonadaceae bacterium]
MTFLAPGFLLAALAAGAVMVALHLIARDRPPRAPLPTARFVPARAEQAVTRALRPADPLLLVVRVLVIALACLAFARPVVEPSKRPVARVVAVDLSRGVGDAAEARDSALALLEPGDALIVFDSSARAVSGAARDSLAGVATSPARGSISAALIVAKQAAVQLGERADSVELVLVSPLATEELDAATAAIRATWHGRLRLVTVAARPDSAVGRLEVQAGADDPIVVAATLLGRSFAGADPGRVPAAAAPAARIVRRRPVAADSLLANAGAVVVWWPEDPAALGWPARTNPDTVGAVIAGDAVVVASFARMVAPPAGQSTVIARWVDGSPAAIERSLGAGCVREVAIEVDPVGDLSLRAEMRRLVARLAEPCGGTRLLEPIGDAERAMLAGGGPLLSSRAIAVPAGEVPPAVPWLLGAALLLALAEPLARMRRGRS